MIMNWSYVAGLFDGEGCVTCGLSTRLSGTHRNWYPVARCVITNTDEAALKMIQANFSIGTIQSYRVIHLGSKTTYSLVICKQADVIRFCRRVYPHSIIKKKQIELLKKAILFIRQNNGKKWSEEKINEYINQFVEENAKLNPNIRGRKRTLKRVFS